MNPPCGNWPRASAFSIGRSASIPVANLQAAFGDSLSEDLRQKHNLILVGRPSQLPVLAEINAQLPAPFDLETEQAIQPALLVNYRLLPGVHMWATCNCSRLPGRRAIYSCSFLATHSRAC